MAGDLQRRVVVLYGLNSVGNASVTWEWDGNDWLQRAAQTPPPRQNAIMVYDANRRRTVLIGGEFSNTILNESWEWDGSTWQQHTPANWTRRYEGGAVGAYDPSRGVIVSYDRFTYEYGPDNPARVGAFGSPCTGAGTTPTLRTHDDLLPWLGDTVPLEVDGTTPNAAAFFLLGLSRTSWALGPLPAPLDPLGLTGCSLLVRPDVPLIAVANGTVASVNLAIPNSAALAGHSVFAQAFPLVANANPAGILATAGAELILGSR